MNEREVLRILTEVGAFITDSHIVYTSWLHGSTYIDKKMLYSFPEETYLFCREIAEEFVTDCVEVVIGPQTGGAILSRWTAHHLTLRTKRRKVSGVYAEKWQGKDTFVIPRRFGENITDRNVLVVDDVLTTGRTVKKVIEAVRIIGGKVIGLGVLCNRGGVTSQNVANVPKLASLANITLDAWNEADCPLCKQGIPVNPYVGKGLEFLARKQARAS